jgi:diguanylate cyclase (GGDEF)-like protein
MDSVEQPYLGIGDLLFSIFTLGTLLTALITFGVLAFHRRHAHVYWSVFALLSLSLLVVGLNTSAIVLARLAGRDTIAFQCHRLYELSTTAFGTLVPYALWAVLPGESKLGRVARFLIGAGISLILFFLVVGFAAPDLFVSVTSRSESFAAYANLAGRGRRGALFPVRDAALGFLVVASLLLGIAAIAGRQIMGTNRLIVGGLMLATLNGSSALYANFVGTYPGPLADIAFSRVGLAITLFALFATAAYVLRYIQQSRALDEANRELELRSDRLTYLAYHNDLTQMPNKQALFRDIDALFAARRGGNLSPDQPFAEAFLCDLDSFGSVEDSYGFSFSVSLLQRVGRRIRAHLSSDEACSGTVYHIEGDRFAILIPNPVSQWDQQRLEQGLIHRISTPINVDGDEVFLSAGIGHYSIAPDAKNAEEVLRRLKRGLAAATESGSRVGRYSADMGAHIEASQHLVQELRRAIREEDFRVHYQPIVNRDGHICSTEALIRWHKADTERFISLAEQSGLIVPITEFVIRTVCNDLAYIRGVAPGISVNINISARHITQIGFPAALETSISARGLDPSSVGVEITETSFLQEDTEVAAILEGLTEAGFAVAIDDFGTGYSSMSYLKQIPATTLKIDRSFIRELPNRREDRALVDAMIALAHDLGKRVVAEGVETPEQASYLLKAGIDCLQGYHYARPVPREFFAQTVASITTTAPSREARP